MSDQYRFFDPEPSVRNIALELYNSIKDLPLVCPHGHVSPELFASNRPFPDPSQLLVVPDHYVFRMLYSQGILLEDIGIQPSDGSPYEKDPEKTWQLFAENFYLFAGTPTGVWLSRELEDIFGITLKLNARNGMEIFHLLSEKLKRPEFLPRAMFRRFNIEVLSTTDGAADTLVHHRAIRDSGWKGRVIPGFRPDDVTNLLHVSWRKNIDALSQAAGIDITSYKHFIMALEKQREFFKSMGAVSTDHGVEEPYTHRLPENEADHIFTLALGGKAEPEHARLFSAHMLMEMARMSIEDGLVMQIHPGCYRNHNQQIFRKFGPDKGSDIPVRTEYTRNLLELLNAFGNNSRFTLIVFTLDESAYSRELAPLAGHYPAMKLGPAWWFHDSIQGMTRHREQVLETAGIYNLVGFIDDTRAFPSIPVRHDLARRIDSNYLARLVSRQVIDMEDARMMNRALACDLSKKAYGL